MTTRSNKREDNQMLSYKIDVLERRLENIEKAVLNNSSSSSNNINSELLHMLMEMLKQQTLAPVAAPTKTSDTHKRTACSQNNAPDQEDNVDKHGHYGFQRRGTII